MVQLFPDRKRRVANRGPRVPWRAKLQLLPAERDERNHRKGVPGGEALIRRRRCGGGPFCGSGRFRGPLIKQVPGDRQNDNHEGEDFLG